MLHKHQGDKLLKTLNSVLMMPDCPGRNEAISTSRAIRQASTPPREATTGTRTSRIPPLRARRGVRVNAVGAASPNSTGTSGSGSGGTSGGSGGRTDSKEYYDYDQGIPTTPNEGAPGPFTNCDEACLNLLQIKVPDRDDTPNNMLTYDNYRRAVLAIRDNPNAAYSQHCIACRGQHRFENCPTLNDHDFLKQHYIRFCQNVRRDQVELSQQRTEPVNFMDRQYFDDDEECDSDQDFSLRPPLNSLQRCRTSNVKSRSRGTTKGTPIGGLSSAGKSSLITDDLTVVTSNLSKNMKSRRPIAPRIATLCWGGNS